jgi:hypothetical protein
MDGDKATGKTPNLKEMPRKRPFSAKQLYAKLRSISRTANSVPRPTYRWENEWISNSLVRERHIRQLVQTLQLDDQVFFLGYVSRPAFGP